VRTTTPASTCLRHWPCDPSDNGGGVLGETLYPNKGIAGAAADLAKISTKLCASVWSADDDDDDEIVARETAETRLRLAANAVPGQDPAWWAALRETILDCDAPEDWVYDYADNPDGIPEAVDYVDPMTLAEFANPVALAVVENLPGLSVSYEILGGMTSGTSYFVWSEDPVEGQATIDAAFASSIRTVEMMIATLDAASS